MIQQQEPSERRAARRERRRAKRANSIEAIRGPSTYVTIQTSEEHSDGGYQLHGEPRVYTRDCCVYLDSGLVTAWDTVGEVFTRHHGLPESEVAKALELAREKATSA